MNFKNEKGITGIDTITGLIIFMLGSVAVLFIYLNMSKIITRIGVNEQVIAYVTQILEEVDKVNYDYLDETKMEVIIDNANVPDIFEVSYSITKYVDEVAKIRQETGTTGEKVEDLVKRVTINIKYNMKSIDIDRDYTISRIKVREI